MNAEWISFEKRRIVILSVARFLVAKHRQFGRVRRGREAETYKHKRGSLGRDLIISNKVRIQRIWLGSRET
jgi:hypothetical protein